MRMTNRGRGHEGYKNRKLFKTSVLKSFLRFLADSNRRTRFCRPLTKPLIQGTDISTINTSIGSLFPNAGAKVILFLIIQITTGRYFQRNYRKPIFQMNSSFHENKTGKCRETKKLLKLSS